MKNKLILGFRIISIIIIIILLFYISNWYANNQHNKKLLSNLSNEFYNTTNTANTNSKLINTEPTNIYEISYNFGNLISQNSDCIAWLKVNNTSIDYPILHATDNNYYLNHSFDKSKNNAGWIFADYRCHSDFSSTNTIIYGHNIKNGSMFATLKNVIKPEWYENSANSIITVYLPSKIAKYKVFSVYQTNYRYYDTAVDFSSAGVFQNYINKIIEKSIYNFGTSISSNDKIITLSTCANNNEYRVVLHAKRIS